MGTQLEIESRTMDYSLRAVKLFRSLKSARDDVAAVIGKQYLRSATSIGANLVEARSGESRRDFIHKCAIAQKEARESLYWLQLIRHASLVPPKRLDALIQETNELLAIITTIIRKSKQTAATRSPSVVRRSSFTV